MKTSAQGNGWGPPKAFWARNRKDPVSSEPERVDAKDLAFQIASLKVTGIDDDEQRELARAAITISPDADCTPQDAVTSVANLRDLGIFREVVPDSWRDRDGGVHVEFKCVPNAPLRRVEVRGGSELPPDILHGIFDGAEGRPCNYNKVYEAMARINEWYHAAGILGGVHVADVDMAATMASGDVTLPVKEPRIGRVGFRFVDADGAEIEGRTDLTRLRRYVDSRSGDVVRPPVLKRDLDELEALGVFDAVTLAPLPPPEGGGGGGGGGGGAAAGACTDVEFHLREKHKFQDFSAKGGLTMEADMEMVEPVGTLSYSNNNVAGTLHRVVGTLAMRRWNDRSVDIEWTNPWLQGARRRVSQTVRAYLTRAGNPAIFGPALDEAHAADSGPSHTQVHVERTAADWERSVPLAKGAIFVTGGIGLSRTRCVDESGEHLTLDPYQWQLTKSGSGYDHALRGSASLVRRGRTSAQRLTASAALPPPLSLVLPESPCADWLRYLRMEGLSIWERGLGSVLGAAARVSISGGSTLGDLPPYEAHPLGGANCVRGFAEGAVGTARHWAVANAEAEVPVTRRLGPKVSGVAFADVGSDFGSGAQVLGDPAGARGKPGRGAGVGAGVRIESPVGLVRFEMGWDAERLWREGFRPGRGRLHISVGPRI